jgi:alkanesulfonate monooxygenase SsuD/methylene tetrahydromethanopterin reductase-like flavin-dependent oxidoreductase (luciferase family)
MAVRASQVGISVIPLADELPQIRALARAADHGGLGLVAIQDHPYQRHFFDTWSLIPTLMAETERVSFVTDVASLPLRPPAVMAKAAATLDVLSGRRDPRPGRQLRRAAAHAGRIGRRVGGSDRGDPAVVV